MSDAPLTAHRRSRVLLWVRVWLTMALRLLPERGGLGPFIGWMAPALLARLRALRGGVLTLIFIAALERLPEAKPPPRVTRYGHAFQRPTGAMRQVLGTALRRATRGRGVRAQILALLKC